MASKKQKNQGTFNDSLLLGPVTMPTWLRRLLLTLLIIVVLGVVGLVFLP